MNFIIEFLPKQENKNEFVYVVRAHNGYPIAVCDTLDDATALMQSKFDEMMQANEPKS